MPVVIVEADHKILIGAPARIVEDGREFAWAERYISPNPAYRFLLGNFVCSEEPNDNGHIFPLRDLEEAKSTLLHSPLNMNHHPTSVVGSFIASEMVYPTITDEESAAASPPYMEALAVMWRYYFPEAFQEIEKAYKDGALSFSMEAIPEEVSCLICEKSFAYDGRVSPTYCADLQVAGAKKKLIKPHFTAGALILPPALPAWKRASINELSSLMSQYEREAEGAYEMAKELAPHKDNKVWEAMMFEAVLQAHITVEGEWARQFTTEQRKKMAGKQAMDDGSFPIVNADDLANAIKAIGRAGSGKRAKVKAHIISRAKALGKTEMLPAGWMDD